MGLYSRDEPSFEALLEHDPNDLRQLPVGPIYSKLRATVLQNFTTQYSLDQLNSHEVHSKLLRPMIKYLEMEAKMTGVFVCLLNYWDFMRESERQLGLKNLFETRARVCELLAVKMLQYHSGQTEDLVTALTFEFSPSQGTDTIVDTNSDEEEDEGSQGEDVSSDIYRHQSIRNSALGIAIRGKAKLFISHSLVQATIQWIWSGEIVFYGKQIDSDQFYSNQENIINHRRRNSTGLGFHCYLPDRFGGIFRPSRIRVPVYQNSLNIIFYLILLTLYSIVLSNKSEEFDFYYEGTLLLFVIGFTADEIRQSISFGIDFYLRNIWNFLDIGIYTIFIVYFLIRFGLLTMEVEGHNFAFDLLACNAILLWPRLLIILDRYPFFGCLIITLKHMVMDATLFFTMAIVFFVGFYQAFCNLAPTDDPHFAPYNILLIMLRIFFGSTFLGFDVAFEFNPILGPVVMLMYITVTALFLTTMLISIFNQSFSSIALNANQEHLFVFTTRVMSFVESESLFPFVPPFNLIQLCILNPLYPFLNPRWYAFINRTFLRITFAPFLILIYLYERFWLNRSYATSHKIRQSHHNPCSPPPPPTQPSSSLLQSPHHHLRRLSLNHLPSDHHHHFDRTTITGLTLPESSPLPSPSSQFHRSSLYSTISSHHPPHPHPHPSDQYQLLLHHHERLERKLDNLIQSLHHQSQRSPSSPLIQ